MDNNHLTLRVVENKPGHDVLYSMIEAPDGSIYCGLCGETCMAGCYAQILSYDKTKGTFKTLVDLADVIPHPEEDIRPPHSKLHTTFCIANDGKLLASTHMTAPPLHEDFYHYWNIYNDPDRCYLGSHLIIYDPKTGKAEDFGVVTPKGGARWMTYNPELEEVYIVSFLTCHFHVIRLKTGEIKDLGRISEHDWLGPCYSPADGRVYTTDSNGNFIRYTPSTETLETIPLITPRAPWSCKESVGIFNLVPGPNGRKLYGSVWNTQHVFEFDPLAGKYGTIRDYGTIGGDETLNGPPYGMRFPRMLTVGADNVIYICGNDYITGDIPHLFAIDADSGEKTDLGEFRVDGFPRFGGATCTCSGKDGSVYFGGNPTGGHTAMYIYSPQGKNLPLPDGYDKFREPNVRETVWMDSTYHSVSRRNNGVFVPKGTFLAHEEGMSGMTPLIPRGEGGITALAQDTESGVVMGLTSGQKCHLFAFFPMIKYFKPIKEIGKPGDKCRTLVKTDNGKLFFGTYRTDGAAGHLYTYDLNAVRSDFFNRETVDRGEFSEFSRLPKGNMVNVVDLGDILSSVGIHEGFYAMTANGDMLYALTYPGCYFVSYNTVTGEIKSKDIFKEYIKELVNLSWTMVCHDNKVIFSGHHGNILIYDTIQDTITDTMLKVPCGPGREYLNSMTALVEAEDGVFYGGTLSDGYLFRLNLNDMTIANLGKPAFEGQIRAMTIGNDGMVWGIAGRNKDLSKLFSYNPATGEHNDSGIIRAKMPSTWIVHRADAIMTGLDGEIYIGENDMISHLITYFPPISKSTTTR